MENKWFFCRMIIVITALVLSGCAMPKGFSDVTIMLESEGSINEGVLLPVDILVANDGLASSALGIGPDDWFGAELRDRLTNEEVQRLAIRGGTTRNVKVSIPEDVRRVIIFADYENNNERFGQQIVITPEKLNFFPKYRVRIRDNRMELVP